jgi:HAD superfamily hydrolase (TIGR01549 family)
VTVKSALVDVGGTLWPEQPNDDGLAVYRRRLQHSLPDVDEATVDLLLEELEARDPAATGLPTTQNTTATVERSVLAAGLNRDLAPAVLIAMQVPARELLNPFPESRDFLARLKEKGLRSVILSNATYRNAALYLRDFSDFGLSDYINAVVSSVDLGIRKPSAEIFEHAFRHTGSSGRSECVVVGDSEEKDIVPAASLGFRTVRVAIETPPPSVTDAETVATSLGQAAQFITDWVDE